jgi:hypothetical protein
VVAEHVGLDLERVFHGKAVPPAAITPWSTWPPDSA